MNNPLPVSHLVIIGLAAWLAGEAAHAQEPGAPAATNAAPPFLLSAAAPAPACLLTAGEIGALWNSFRVADTNRPAIRYLCLPLRVTGDASPPAALGAAFAFFLSNELEWHPMAVPAAYAHQLNRYWRSGGAPALRGVDLYTPPARPAGSLRTVTHYVGGELTAQGARLGVELILYDGAGRETWRAKLPPREGFFNALGDAAMAVLGQWDYCPAAALSRHLRQPRCKGTEPLVELGGMLLAPAKPAAAQDAYRALIAREPGMVEVKQLLAAEAGWGQVFGKGTNDLDYLTVTLLRHSEVMMARFARGGGKELEALLGRVESLAGAESPLVAELRLRVMQLRPQHAAGWVRSALETLASYPAHPALASSLVSALSDQGSVNDPALAASVGFACLLAGSDESDPNRRYSSDRVARALTVLGFEAQAAALYRAAYTNAVSAKYTQLVPMAAGPLGGALARMGRFDEAAAVYAVALQSPVTMPNRAYAVPAGIAALLGGRTELLRRIEDDDELVAAIAGDDLRMLKAYEAMSRGEIRTIWELKEQYGIFRDDPAVLAVGMPYSYLIDAGLDLRGDGTLYREEITDLARRHPGLRAVWIAYDAYDRRATSPESAAFYRALQWLHGDDPWVKEAAAAYEARAGERAAPDVRGLQTKLRPFKAEAWPVLQAAVQPVPSRLNPLDALPPGTFADVVAQLLADGDRAAARDIVLRGLAAAQGSLEWRTLVGHLNYLYHRIEGGTSVQGGGGRGG